MKFFRRTRHFRKPIDPDEIFLDSKNLPNFNTQQFEGRLEQAIPKRAVIFLGVFFIAVSAVFLWRLSVLQILKGTFYAKKGENNTLIKQPIFADRGLIYDRRDTLLSWNIWDPSDVNKFSSPLRAYINQSGFGLLLGYVSPPAKDSSGRYWQDIFIGRDGIEKLYDNRLVGTNGVRITETDVSGEIQSENIVTQPKPGDELHLAIDSRVQNKLYDSISAMARNSSFSGGAGAIMDIENGELIALVSYPEYNSNILSARQDKKTISGYFTDRRKVFLNRAVSGLYTPGSIVKPFVAYGALVEGVIDPFKSIFANGTISIPNPYFPEKKSIFKDHDVFGYVDMREAIAVSSDIYFYEIGGGYQDQKGMGIANIDKYAKLFGIGEKTNGDFLGEKNGIIPTPEWKSKTFNGEPWRVGDTYNTSIGQYGFQVTPIQMVRAVAGIATDGVLPTPHLLRGDTERESLITRLPVDSEKMKVVKEGMRQAVMIGTARALNLPAVKVAAKSGTAQVGLGNTNTNSWIMGFFPYEKPRYSFVVLMERGPKSASGNATRVMAETLDFMSVYTPEYTK